MLGEGEIKSGSVTGMKFSAIAVTDLQGQSLELSINGKVTGEVRGMFGRLYLNGSVAKGIDCRGAYFNINGRVEGKSVISAQRIVIGKQALFNNDVRYWSEDKTLPMELHVRNGKSMYVPSLRILGEKWYYLGSTSFLRLLWYLGMALVMILIIQFLFSQAMQKAADRLYNHSLKSFGMGILFFIGIPILAVIAFVSLVGVPVGLLLMLAYVILVLLATVITSVVLTHWINNRYEKKWGSWRIGFAAFGIFITLKLISLAPFVGWVILMLLVCSSFGSLLLNIRFKKQRAG